MNEDLIWGEIASQTSENDSQTDVLYIHVSMKTINRDA